jgi:hypothetical protein
MPGRFGNESCGRRVEIVKAEPARLVMAFGPHGLRMQLTVDEMAELLRKLG